MKTMKKMLLALCALTLAAGVAWAVDYSQLSNDDLSAKRGTMYNASPEEWNAFHTEWWKRLSQMSPEERQNRGRERSRHGPGDGQGHG